eukprot:scpid36109/ scgid6912/ Interferon regulatory factor 1
MERESDIGAMQRCPSVDPLSSYINHASSGSNGSVLPTPAQATGAAASSFISPLGPSSMVQHSACVPGMNGSGSSLSMMAGPSYMTGLHGQPGNMAGSLYSAPELKTERKLFLPFLEQLLDEETIEGLHWIDRDKRIFRMPWKHMKRHDYIQEKDAALFKAWAINSGKYKETDPDPSRWKINFRSALNTMKHVFVEIMDENVDRDDCRIFRIAVPPTETAAANRRKRAMVPVLAQRTTGQAPIKPCPVTAAMPTFADYGQTTSQTSDQVHWQQQQQQMVSGGSMQASGHGWAMGRVSHAPGQGAMPWAGQSMGQVQVGWSHTGITQEQHSEMLRLQEAQAGLHDAIEIAKAQFNLENVGESGEPITLEGTFHVIYCGSVSSVTLHIILQLSFPRQPPDVIVVHAEDVDLCRRCESLIQQMDYNLYWSYRSCNLIGFLDSLATELERHDLREVICTTPPLRVLLNCRAKRPSRKQRSRGWQTHGRAGRSEGSPLDAQSDPSEAQGAADSGEAAAGDNAGQSESQQGNRKKRKHSAFQPYRKPEGQGESGTTTGSPKRIRTLGPPPLARLSDQEEINKSGARAMRGHEADQTDLTNSSLRSGDRDNEEQTARQVGKYHDGAGEMLLDSNFPDLKAYCIYLEDQCAAKDLQLQKKSSSLKDYQARIAELDRAYNDMQHHVQRQVFEISDLRQCLDVKQALVDKLESQLSVSKYYLTSAQQKLNKAPYLSQVRRDDREVVDILVRRKPQPVHAAMSIPNENDANGNESEQMGGRHTGGEDSVGNSSRRLLATAATVPIGFGDEGKDHEADAETDSIHPVEHIKKVTDYESKCVPWEGFSSDSSRAASPTALVLDTAGDSDCAEEAETRTARLGNLYFEDDAPSPPGMQGESHSGAANHADDSPAPVRQTATNTASGEAEERKE